MHFTICNKKCFYFSAVDRFRCIIQPDKPHFSARSALLISFGMVLASILLSLPMYINAKVSFKLSFLSTIELALREFSLPYICEFIAAKILNFGLAHSSLAPQASNKIQNYGGK